jgi:hypothetical protein
MQEKSFEEAGHVLLRVWGSDKRGQLLNLLLTYPTAKIARSAASAALVELGARVRFWITP